MAGIVDVGDTVILVYPSLPANATSVTVAVSAPDNTVTTASALSGTYSYSTSQPGRHTVLWQAVSPAGTDAYADMFDVAPSDLGGIISLADAKAQLRVTTSQNDEELRLYIAAATALVEHEVGPVLQSTHVEIVESDQTIVLAKAPVISITSIVPTFTAPYPIAVPSYSLEAASGILRQQPFYFAAWGFDWAPGALYGYRRPIRLTVTYTAGRPVIPAPLQVAARIIVRELWKTRQLSGPKPASGDEEMPYGREIVPDEAVLLMAPYRRAPLVA